MIFGLIYREISVFALQAVIGDKTSSKPPNIEWEKNPHRFACSSILQQTYMRICVAKSPRKGCEDCLSVYVKKHKK